MDHAAALEKVTAIVRPFAKHIEALNNATDATRIIEDLGVNSARLVDIVLEFEDEFGISIDDEAADKVRTIGDAVQLIVLKTATAS